ncbi:MAG: hypothetical protein ABF271_09120 [Abyssibacter sp.]|uniref:hypothetical protein n=1 Tax=Abyssibacter sp. TaxID=2320200 RepID=UPI00321A1100
MSAATAFWLVALPTLGALVAVGALLAIKVRRRRDAASDPQPSNVVPAKPMSQTQAHRLLRRYLWAVAAVLALLGLFLLAVAAR